MPFNPPPPPPPQKVQRIDVDGDTPPTFNLQIRTSGSEPLQTLRRALQYLEEIESNRLNKDIVHFRLKLIWNIPSHLKLTFILYFRVFSLQNI